MLMLASPTCAGGIPQSLARLSGWIDGVQTMFQKVLQFFAVITLLFLVVLFALFVLVAALLLWGGSLVLALSSFLRSSVR